MDSIVQQTRVVIVFQTSRIPALIREAFQRPRLMRRRTHYRLDRGHSINNVEITACLIYVISLERRCLANM